MLHVFLLEDRQSPSKGWTASLRVGPEPLDRDSVGKA
jgi:hypothetical protein